MRVLDPRANAARRPTSRTRLYFIGVQNAKCKMKLKLDAWPALLEAIAAELPRRRMDEFMYKVRGLAHNHSPILVRNP